MCLALRRMPIIFSVFAYDTMKYWNVYSKSSNKVHKDIGSLLLINKESIKSHFFLKWIRLSINRKVLCNWNSSWSHYICGLAETNIGWPLNRSKFIKHRLCLEIPLGPTEKMSVSFLTYCNTKCRYRLIFKRIMIIKIYK